MDELIIGVDIGGTSVKIGLINHDGEIVYKWEIPTNKDNQGRGIVDDIWNSITETLSKQNIASDIIGIGVGAPGFVNRKTGIVEEAVNIGWKNFELRDAFHKLSHLPVFIENDANLAALAENWQGSGEQSKDVMFITLGTGVGGGIIVNGEIMNGVNGTAAELGHILVDPNGSPCNCGRTGCLETIASATGIVRQAMDEVTNNSNGALASFYKQQGKLEAKDVFNLAQEGDMASENIIDKTMDVLGLAIANTAVIINPSQIIIGGGVSKAGEQLLSKINRSFKKYALPRISECCELRLAELGNDAGIIGAAYLVKKSLNNLE